jgi:hypothetical protein
LSKLPDKYRAAVVLCDLEGLPRAEAAVRLQIPEGTLSSRLAHARKVLAGRLTRRGISSTAGAVAVILTREALGGTIPRDLVVLTARAATRVARGEMIPPDIVSPHVTSLTDGVMKAMLVYRLRLSLSVVLAVGLLGLGAYGIAQVPAQNSLPPHDFVRVDPGQNPFDPLAAPIATQVPKAEKVAAKGIEDDDVPFPATPTQAVVRMEEGKLIVRQRGSHVAPVTVTTANGTPVTSYQRKSGVHATTYDPADVSVFDMKGNRLLPKAWKDKLKNDLHALVAFDGRLPNPRELGLFKDDILIVVLPAQSGGAATYAETFAPSPTVPGVPSSSARPGGAAAPSIAPPSVPAPGRPGLPPRPGTGAPPPPPDGATTVSN